MLRFLLKHLGAGVLGRELRKIAEGAYGPGPKDAYWTLVGLKTWLGFAAGVASAVMLFVYHNDSVANFMLGSFGAVLISAGLIDKNWRSGIPIEISEWKFYKLARNHSADIAAVVAYCAVQVSTCSLDLAAALAPVHLNCHKAALLLTIASVLLVQLGLMSEAKLVSAPVSGPTAKSLPPTDEPPFGGPTLGAVA